MAKNAKSNKYDLGPTGPATVPRKAKADYDAKHPNPGNVSGGDQLNAGPMPTDDPHHKLDQLEKKIDEARKRASRK